jgi:TPP-dependent pyruvate/acetoin dehydrogenase alpha subunit
MPDAAAFDSPTLWGMLRRMALSRLVELFIALKYPEQKMRCPTHLCIGQESSGAAFATVSHPGDIAFGNYRSHGHYLSRGGDIRALFAEILGLAGGCSGGLGGSMHLIDLEKGFYGSSAIVGSTAPIAAGAALRFRMTRTPNIAIVFFGDGAMEEGVLYETAGICRLYEIPLVMVCENNRMAVLTPLEQRSKTATMYDRFTTMGIEGILLEGTDPMDMLHGARRACDEARKGRPVFVEIRLDRWAVHVGHQFEGPIDAWWKAPAEAKGRCAIARCAQILLDRGDAKLGDLQRIRQELQQSIEHGYAEALEGPPPALETLQREATAGGLLSRLPESPRSLSGTQEAHREQHPLVNPF